MSQASLVIQETPLDAIRLHPRNLRRQVGDIAELAQSRKERGVLEPLIVAPVWTRRPESCSSPGIGGWPPPGWRS